MEYTKEFLQEMFESINPEDYESLKDLASSLGIGTSTLTKIRTNLSSFGLVSELTKVEDIKTKGMNNCKNKFVALCKVMKEAEKLILSNGTELEYLMKYKWQTKKEFTDILNSVHSKAPLSKEDYAKIMKFIANIESLKRDHFKYSGITKSMILSEKKIIGIHEVTISEKNLAMNYLNQCNIRWTTKLYNQAIKKVLKEEGVLD